MIVLEAICTGKDRYAMTAAARICMNIAMPAIKVIDRRLTLSCVSCPSSPGRGAVERALQGLLEHGCL